MTFEEHPLAYTAQDDARSIGQESAAPHPLALSPAAAPWRMFGAESARRPANDIRPYRITFCLNLYQYGSDRPLANQAVKYLLKSLTLMGVDYLRAHPEVPSLYQSGVRYEEEPPGQEDWQDIPTTLALGVGDCEDLACWRAAELQVRSGVRAWPSFVQRRRPAGGLLYHIQVRYPCQRKSADGTCEWLTEDPSRRLGMR